MENVKMRGRNICLVQYTENIEMNLKQESGPLNMARFHERVSNSFTCTRTLYVINWPVWAVWTVQTATKRIGDSDCWSWTCKQLIVKLKRVYFTCQGSMNSTVAKQSMQHWYNSSFFILQKKKDYLHKKSAPHIEIYTSTKIFRKQKISNLLYMYIA